MKVKPNKTIFCGFVPPVEAKKNFMNGFTPETDAKIPFSIASNEALCEAIQEVVPNGTLYQNSFISEAEAGHLEKLVSPGF